MKKYSQNPMSKTSQSFRRPQLMSSFYEQQEQLPQYSFNLQQLKALIQNEVFRSLSLIKGQIETKIKQIDQQIRDVKERIYNIQDENNKSSITEIEHKQFQIIAMIKQIIEKNKIVRQQIKESRNHFDRNSYLNESRERQNSKDRKPIFNKQQHNLSTVLFPFIQTQQAVEFTKQNISQNKNTYHIPIYSIPQPAQSIRQLNSLIIGDGNQKSSLNIPMNLSPKTLSPISPIISNNQFSIYQTNKVRTDQFIQGLVKNKNKFLKKKSTQDLRKDIPSNQLKYDIIQEEEIEESVLYK